MNELFLKTTILIREQKATYATKQWAYKSIICHAMLNNYSQENYPQKEFQHFTAETLIDCFLILVEF